MEEQQEEQHFAPQLLQQGEKADLLEQIRPDEIVETIRNRLLGREFKNGEWILNPILKERALTERGAWDLSNLMLSVSSRNVSISKLKDEEIRKRTLNICKQAQSMMLKNWAEYGIQGTDQLGFVHEIIMSNTLITLKQPEGEGIRKLLMGTFSETSYTQKTPEEKVKGLRGMFRR